MSNVANDAKSRLYRVVRSGSKVIAQAPTSTNISKPGNPRTHSSSQRYQTEEGRDRYWGAGGHTTGPFEATDGEKEIQKYSCPLHQVARSAQVAER